jgi:signal peptidase II
MKHNDKGAIFLLASLVFLLDRLSKYIVVAGMAEGQAAKILPGIFHITLVLNKGAAFGFLKNGGPFFILLSSLVILSAVFYILKNDSRDRVLSLALGLILGGAAGNLTDRVYFGYVIDFLDLRVWPVFNIADSFITIGAALVLWKLLFRKKA